MRPAAVAEDRVVGYYALATGSVHKYQSPERIAKGLAHPIGICCWHGWPLTLSSNALKRIEEAANIVGIRTVLVHAIDDAARRFYEHFNLTILRWIRFS